MYTLEHTQAVSPTAVICENLEQFGGAPAKGDPDSRAIWDRDEALAGLEAILDTFVDEIAPDGTQLADERESLLWGFVNTLHMQSKRLDRAVDRLAPELKNLQRAQDGTEINAWELERIIERARNLGDRRDAFEQLRDAAAEHYRHDTGKTWRPRHGSHTSRTAQLTSAAIDARDFLRARENEKTQAHLPEGTLVAVTGSKPVDNAQTICTALDHVHGKYPDMVLVHGGGPGCRKDRGALGRVEGRPPGRLQARLEHTRTGRSVPEKRPAPETPAQGPHQLPGQRRLRQPGRQGHPARYPRAQNRDLTVAPFAGRVPPRDSAARFVLNSMPPGECRGPITQ